MLSILSAPLLLAVSGRLIPQIVASPLVAEIDISVESSDLNDQHAPNLLLYPLPNLRGRPFELYIDQMECVDIPSEVAQNVYSTSIVDPMSCVFVPEKHCKLPWNRMDRLEKVRQGGHQEVSDNVRAAKSVRCGEDSSMGFNTQKNMEHHRGFQSLQSKPEDKEINSVLSNEETYMHSFNMAENHRAKAKMNQLSNADYSQLFAENRPNGQPNGTVTMYTYPNFKGQWKKFRVFSQHCYLEPRKLSNNVKSIVISAKIDSCTFWSERDCKGDPYWLPAGKSEDLKNEGTSFVSFECLLAGEEDPEDPGEGNEEL